MDSSSSPPRAGSPDAMLKRAFSLPISQMAWREVQRGPPAQALEQRKVPVVHDLAPGELLVKVEAAALNPIGYKLMQMLPDAVAKRPHTAENDFTGTVVATQGVTGFENGDAVCGWISQAMSQMTSQGALCEYVRVRADHVIPRPVNITPVQGAGVCLAGLSAWKLLFHDAKVTEGQRILIYNASGGVGSFAVQIAKATGCHVTATASVDSADFVKKLGADVIIDYRKESVLQQFRNALIEPFDAIIDCYGMDDSLYANCDKYLKPEGVFASVAPASTSLLATATAGVRLFTQTWRPKWLGGAQRTFRMLNLENSKDELRGLQGLIASGKVVPAVDSIFKFDDALLAYKKLMTGHARGKVIVAVDPQVYLQARRKSTLRG